MIASYTTSSRTETMTKQEQELPVVCSRLKRVSTKLDALIREQDPVKEERKAKFSSGFRSANTIEALQKQSDNEWDIEMVAESIAVAKIL
jgi:hypothetical protein